MTLFVSKIERARLIQESTFGTDASGSLGSYYEVPFVEGTGEVKVNQPLESPRHAQQLVDGIAKGVLMPKAASYKFTCNLETITTKATSTVAPAQHWLGYMLECAMGAKSLTTGTAITTGASSTVLPVSVATTLHPGCAVGLNTGTGGALEIREIKSKSGSNITLKLAASSSAANSAAVLGSATYYCNPYTTGAEFVGMQFICEGQNTVDRFLLKGGWLESLALAIEPGAIPKLTFSWNFADWDRLDGSASSGDTTGDTLGLATYTNVNTLVAMDSELRVPTVGTSTLSGTLVHASSMEWKPNIKFAVAKSTAGINTVLQAVRTQNAPVLSGAFTIPFEDSMSWFDARDNRTNKAVFQQIGSSTSDGGVLISAPTTQIMDVQRMDVDGIIGQRIDWMARIDEDTTAETSYEAVAKSAFRMHFV